MVSLGQSLISVRNKLTGSGPGNLHWWFPPALSSQRLYWCQNGSMPLIAFGIILCLPCRKKVLDFYQRACLSGYCSAFAYKPMHCALSSQLNGKCIELVQVPGQNAIFTSCDLPGTTPIKQSSRRNSWSSDGTSLSSSCGMYCWAGSLVPNQSKAVAALLSKAVVGNWDLSIPLKGNNYLCCWQVYFYHKVT